VTTFTPGILAASLEKKPCQIWWNHRNEARIEVLPASACAIGPGRFDGHASPLAEGEGELGLSDARRCWHPEVKQCGHRTVVQLPRRVEGPV
jgi:hypothetical protein